MTSHYFDSVGLCDTGEFTSELVDFREAFGLSGGQNLSEISPRHFRSRSRATSIGSCCGLSTLFILAVFAVSSVWQSARYGPK